MSDTAFMVMAVIFVFGMVVTMVLAVAIPFFFGLHMLYTKGDIRTKVFIMILYTVLIFLFIQFKMYNITFK